MFFIHSFRSVRLRGLTHPKKEKIRKEWWYYDIFDIFNSFSAACDIDVSTPNIRGKNPEKTVYLKNDIFIIFNEKWKVYMPAKARLPAYDLTA